MEQVTLRILGKTYRIEYVEADVLQQLGVDGACMSNGRILIADNLNDEDRRETVIHEILHAVWKEMDIGYSDRTEEKCVTALGKGLAAIIADNAHAQELFR